MVRCVPPHIPPIMLRSPSRLRHFLREERGSSTADNMFQIGLCLAAAWVVVWAAGPQISAAIRATLNFALSLIS